MSDGGTEILVDVGGGPNGLTLGPDGCIFICNNGGLSWTRRDGRLHPVLDARDYSGGRIERFDPGTDMIEMLYRRAEQGALNGPNDQIYKETQRYRPGQKISYGIN